MAVWQWPVLAATAESVRAKMILAVQAYNLKRAIKVLGAQKC